MRIKEQFAYRIRPIGDGRWAVYDYKSNTELEVFDSPIIAAEWARERLIAKAERSKK
jgi:hypothetical protein